MGILTSVFKRVFRFSFGARTSRGAMKTRTSWFLKVWHKDYPERAGYGECAPLPGLSIDDVADYQQRLQEVADALTRQDTELTELAGDPDRMVTRAYPSITFGVETALRDLANGGQRVIFRNSFIAGTPIPINGLIWMGDSDFMTKQIHDKVAQGFTCLKLKIGGIDFREECRILENVRRLFGDSITIRLDANGSFSDDAAMERLNRLSTYNIHSIEQPVRVGSPILPMLCSESPIPVALDEELIALTSRKQRQVLLDDCRPQYIILKPSLHGGMQGCNEWITLARERGIGWWITSALESGIGLNAICQYTAGFEPVLPQGLGTGAIYSDNIASPLVVRNGSISYEPSGQWSLPDAVG